MSELFRDFPRDGIIEHILAGCDHFTLAMPSVRLVPETPLILRSYVDDDSVQNEIREQGLGGEVVLATNDFLYKATIDEIITSDYRVPLDALFEPLGGAYALTLDGQKLARTRTRLWCTIWPFCRTRRPRS
jgi:hypothetical protein